MATVIKDRLEQPGVVRLTPTAGNWNGLGVGVYTLWRKHMKKFSRSTMEIGGTLFTPILWMLLFGLSMNGMARDLKGLPTTTNYLAYITPGIMLLTGLSAAIIGGSTLLMERTSGVIKEYLVAPVPRLAVFAGYDGERPDQSSVAIGCDYRTGADIGIGLAMESPDATGRSGICPDLRAGFCGGCRRLCFQIEGMESYHALITVFNLPLLFLSNALYPLSQMPTFLAVLSYLNPTTYAVDATRNLFYGTATEIGLWIDLPVLLAFMVLAVWWGYRSFQKSVAGN